jgi:salicylate hydroxylase
MASGRLPETYPFPSYRTSAFPLNIVVVGCGLGGLAAAHCLTQAGHHVTIVESAPVIGEVGAGIQVSPNSSRLLRRWGLSHHLEEVAVRPEAIAFHRYNTGERVGYTKWGDLMDRDYGAPYYHVHRADFHKMLYDLVAPRVTLRLSSTVVSCDPGPLTPSVTLASGEVITADLIVGADGVKSMIQQVVMGKATRADSTGDAAYRATIPASLLLEDPELRNLIETPEMSAWMGPRRHVMAYPIVSLIISSFYCILVGVIHMYLQRGKKEYNIVLLHPHSGSIESWTAEGNADKMRQQFDDFEPRSVSPSSKVYNRLNPKAGFASC